MNELVWVPKPLTSEPGWYFTRDMNGGYIDVNYYDELALNTLDNWMGKSEFAGPIPLPKDLYERVTNENTELGELIQVSNTNRAYIRRIFIAYDPRKVRPYICEDPDPQCNDECYASWKFARRIKE